MPESKESSITKELEGRLDHFFSDHETGCGFQKTEHAPRSFFLKELRSLLLSIDWEISDDTITRFTDTVSDMEKTCRDDKDLLVFLQILEAIASYIKRHKAKSHPGAMGVLNSAFYALEKTALNEGITNDEKRKILQDEVKNFKNLKKQIAMGRVKKHSDGKRPSSKGIFACPGEKPTVRPIIKDNPLPGEKDRDLDKRSMPSHEALACAMEEIKDLIRQEFRSLREEVALWKQTEAKGSS